MRRTGPATATIDAAAASARAGRPAVVGIEGHSGYGKSTLLRAIAQRLDGFYLFRAYGEPDAQDDRCQLLNQWCGQPHPRHTMQGIGLLHEAVDSRQLTGPVALIVDDLQWIDPESVEVLAALIERAEGDRLLVIAAYRPLGRRHPAWRRLDTITVHLDGLDEQAAAALVASHDLDAPIGLAAALRTHTGGNPAYMRALLREHSTAQLAVLAGRGELPAPADLAASLEARVNDLSIEAANMLHALAVLGDTWSDLGAAAAVGEVKEPDLAVKLLAEENLVRLDSTSPAPRARLSHAVIQTAAYDTIPTSKRRQLHGAAAARLMSTGERLRHRLLAATSPDEGLAGDLDRHADDRHQRLLYREAARLRRMAARVSATDAARDRRLLDADVEALLATDFDDMSVTDADNEASPQHRLVHALYLSATKRWVDSARVLDEVDIAALDPTNAYRALLMHAWTTLASGRSPTDALQLLQIAERCPIKDTAFLGLLIITRGQIQQATVAPGQPLWGFDDALDIDRAALANSPEGLHRLTWRGAVSAITGSTFRAVGDLTLVAERMDDGALELSDGIIHALLGFAQWHTGDWRRSSINMDLAQTFVRGVPHPTVLAVSPLQAITNGEDFRDAVKQSRRARIAGPIAAAIFTGDIAEIAALAFAGTPSERRSWRSRRTADFGAPRPDATSRASALWMLAMGLGAAWAEDAQATEQWADVLAQRPGQDWRSNAVAWLRALSRGIRGQARALDDIARRGLPGLDSFAALLWVDAAQAGDPNVRSNAQAALTTLGAGRYTTTLLPHAVVPADPLAPLSTRERDVAALMLEGLTYVQIARELHVSRGTVAFHLSNAYAKTNTSTRHELLQLVRSVTGPSST